MSPYMYFFLLKGDQLQKNLGHLPNLPALPVILASLKTVDPHIAYELLECIARHIRNILFLFDETFDSCDCSNGFAACEAMPLQI